MKSIKIIGLTLLLVIALLSVLVLADYEAGETYEIIADDGTCFEITILTSDPPTVEVSTCPEIDYCDKVLDESVGYTGSVCEDRIKELNLEPNPGLTQTSCLGVYKGVPLVSQFGNLYLIEPIENVPNVYSWDYAKCPTVKENNFPDGSNPLTLDVAKACIDESNGDLVESGLSGFYLEECVVYTCDDPDNPDGSDIAKSLFTQSYVRIYDENNDLIKSSPLDLCANYDNKIVEYSCVGTDSYELDILPCPVGTTCSDGACEAVTTCDDPDKGSTGNSLLQQSFVIITTGGVETLSPLDSCITSGPHIGKVKEYFCNGLNLGTAVKSCPDGMICNGEDGFCSDIVEDCTNGEDDDGDTLVDCMDLDCFDESNFDGFTCCADGTSDGNNAVCNDGYFCDGGGNLETFRCIQCEGASDCSGVGEICDNGLCVVDSVCDSDNLDLCNTQELCTGISKFWYDDVCLNSCPAGTLNTNGVCTLIEVVTCVDPDKDNNPLTQQTTVVSKLNGAVVDSEEDTCILALSKVKEYSCLANGGIQYNNLDCPAGTSCSVGACKPVVAITLGDVNGKDGVTPSDAVKILEHSVGLITLTNDQLEIADVNCVDGVTPSDAVKILEYSVGLITTLEC